MGTHYVLRGEDSMSYNGWKNYEWAGYGSHLHKEVARASGHGQCPGCVNCGRGQSDR